MMAEAKKELRIGLLGQPNTGKSTFFNGVTGGSQHVGNWPGKTVERKTGRTAVGAHRIEIVDLPGTYSLNAASAEERITRDYVCGGGADAIVALVDASQLERSMYLLSDYVGIGTPLLVALNMTDVALGRGMKIDTAALSRRLGVPVIPTVATKQEGIAELMEGVVALGAAEGGAAAAGIAPEALEKRYRDAFGADYDELRSLLPARGIDGCGAGWLAAKLLEGDKIARESVRLVTPESAERRIEAILGRHPDGAIAASGCRYAWIRELLSEAVVRSGPERERRNAFDRIATHPIWGKPIAVAAVLLGFVLSMIVAMPFMGGLSALIPVTKSAVEALARSMGAPRVIVSLLTEAFAPGLYMSVMIAAFMFGVSLVFGFLEDVGFMARIAYSFDSLMSRIGLHGKSIMPFLLSFGCNMGGISGARVIDSQQQRLLTIAVSLAIPCAGIWGVVGLMSGLFFGLNAGFAVAGLFALMVLHMTLTSWVFGRKLIKGMDASGLIMELPPYHRPNWKTIFGYVRGRMLGTLRKALKIIMGVSLLIWALSYTSDGDASKSAVYAIGKFIEPVGLLFGMDWRLFTAFLMSALSKEAALGVIAVLMGMGTDAASMAGMLTKTMHVDTSTLSATLTSTVSPASAAAFLVAYFFNIPCLGTLAAVRIETRSLKWTLVIAAYYIAVALILAGIVYRAASLFI